MTRKPEDKHVIQTKKCAANLRAIMNYRNRKISQLANITGISRRTIESYTSGKVSLLDARAENVLKIANALDADIKILLGAASMESFYRREETLLRRRRGRMPIIESRSDVIRSEDGEIESYLITQTITEEIRADGIYDDEDE